MGSIQLVWARSAYALIALWSALGGMQQPPSVESLLENLASGTRAAEAACQLGRTKDPRAFTPLLSALERNPSPGVRTCAASALGDLGDTRAVEPLLRALDDPDRTVRAMVAYALGAYPEPHVLRRLVDVLGRDDDPGTRSSAANGLARARDASAVESLARALRDERTPAVRSQIAQALGSFPGMLNAADALVSSLASDSEPSVRSSAARSLGRLKDPRARGPLQRALEDADPAVRREAASALARLGGQPPP